MPFQQWVILITFCCCASHASAQARVSGTISLHDAVGATLAANPRLDSFPLREAALSGQREIADLRPPLNVNAGIENAIGSGDLNGFNGAELTLSLSRVVEMGNKRIARTEVANRRIDLLDAEQRILELDLLAETTFRFIDTLAAQERVTLQQEALDLASQTVTLMAPLVEAGQTPALELVRANAALERARVAQALAQNTLESARIRLSGMWGASTPQFDQVEAELYSIGSPEPLTALLLALENNPDITLYANETRLREAQLRQARAQQESNIQWTAGVRHLKELDDTALVFNVSIPLASRQRASGAIRSAQAQIAEVETRRQVSLNEMRTQLRTLQLQLDQAILEANVLQDNVLPGLNEVLMLTREAFETGRYSYVEMTSAQREYLDAELALINSAANAHRLRAEIERLSGEPLPARDREE